MYTSGRLPERMLAATASRGERTRKHWLNRAMVATLLMGAYSAPVMAQQSNNAEQDAANEDSQSVPTIVVTARKRSEDVQSVPIAISAFTGDMLEARGAIDIEDSARLTPNLTIGHANGGSGGSSNSEIYMRGIGQNDFLITTDPGVGLYVDDVYVARSTGTVLDFLDVERVEILRGPQGTLFGRNTIGGAISLISKKPAGVPGGDIQVSGGRFSRYTIKGSVDIPFSDQFRTRHTLYYNNENGFTIRLNGPGNLGDKEVIAGRSLAQWSPTENFDALFAFDFSHQNGNSANDVLLQYDPTSGLAPLWQALVGTPQGIASPAIVNINDPRNSSGTAANVDDHRIYGISGTLEWDVGAFQIKSISAYRKLHAQFGRDGDNSPVQYIQTDDTVRQDQFTQELQLKGEAADGALSWLLGGYFLDENATDSNQVRLASGLFSALEGLPGPVIFLGGPPGTSCADFGTVPGVVCAGGAGNPVNAGFDLDFDVFNKINTTNYSFFTHNTFKLSDRVSVSAGLRWTHDAKKYFLDHKRINSGAQLIPPTTVRNSWNTFLPKFSIDVKLTDDVFTYVSASRGFKSGGFNGRPTTQAEVGSFDPETLWDYEAGIKSELFNKRLRLNIGAFYYDYKNIQLTVVSADPTGNLVLIVENAGKARTKGLEAEFQARPSPLFSFDGAIGYLHARYKSLKPGATVTLANRLIKTPKVTANAGMNIYFPQFGSWEASLRADWTYRGSFFEDAQNTPILRQKAYSLFNARLTLANNEQGWELAIYGTNIGNKRYLTSGLSALASFGTVEGVLGSPSRWGISVKKSF